MGSCLLCPPLGFHSFWCAPLPLGVDNRLKPIGHTFKPKEKVRSDKLTEPLRRY